MKFSSLLFLLSFSIMLFSCSKDDDDVEKEEQATTAEIIGIWKEIYTEGYEDYINKEKEIEKWTYTKDFMYREFKSDKQGRDYYIENNIEQPVYPFSWSLKNKTLTCIDEDGYIDEYTIIKLTSTTLILEEKGSDDIYEWYFKTTFVREK